MGVQAAFKIRNGTPIQQAACRVIRLYSAWAKLVAVGAADSSLRPLRQHHIHRPAHLRGTTPAPHAGGATMEMFNKDGDYNGQISQKNN